MTPRSRFRVRLGLNQLSLYAYFAISGVGFYLWLDPDKLSWQEREMWPLTLKGKVFIASWVVALLVYFVAITRFRCPRCNGRLRVFRDLGWLAYRGWDKANPCPHCGLNFDEDWPSLTTVSEAIEEAERWASKPKNPIS